MTSDLINSEVNRFKRVAEIFDHLSREIDKFPDQLLRQEIYNNLCDLEDLIYKSPEWESRSVVDSVNMSVFGSRVSGQRTVLKKFLPYDIEKYSLDSAIRSKHIIPLENNPQMILLRYDGDFLPVPTICDWSDCAMFMFNVNDEETYTHALICHMKFIEATKDCDHIIPTILVGILSPVLSTESVNPTMHRLISYDKILQNAKEQKFNKYIEVRPDTSHNIDFLFNYATRITVKYKLNRSNKTDLNDFVIEEKENILNKSIDPRRKSFADYFKKPSSLNKTKVSTKDSNQKGRNNLINRKLLRRDSIAKPLSNCMISGSMLSISTGSSGDNDEDSVKDSDYLEWSQCKTLIQGQLTKIKSTYSSQSVYVTITNNGKMFYHSSEKSYRDGKKPKFIDLITFNVKAPGYNAQYNRINNINTKKKISDRTFEMCGSLNGQLTKIEFKADNADDRNKWVESINKSIFAILNKNLLSNQEHYSDTLNSLSDIKTRQCNDVCAECDAPTPSWIIRDLGIFVCLRCSGPHRSCHRVQSSQLDAMDPLQMKILSVLGNAIVNSVFEATLDLTDVRKPEPGSESIEDWFHMKYIEKRFIAPVPIKDQRLAPQLMMAITEDDYRTQLICIHNGSAQLLNESYSDSDERNALLIASQSGLPITVQLLIWAGVDVHVKDSRQINAYGYASYEKSDNHREVLTLLTSAGVAQQVLNDDTADVNATTNGSMVTSLDESFSSEISDSLSLAFVTKRRK